MHTADYCPMTSGVEVECAMEGDASLVPKMDIEHFGKNSRCVETNLERPLCLKLDCNRQLRKVVMYFDQYDPIICDKDRDMVQLPGNRGGSVKCPDFESICPQ